MALLPTNKEKKINASDIKIKDDVKISYDEKVYQAKDRRPIQIDPPVLKMISNISYAKDIPMYKVVEKAIDSYLNNLSENERKLYEIRNNTK